MKGALAFQVLLEDVVDPGTFIFFVGYEKTGDRAIQPGGNGQ